MYLYIYKAVVCICICICIYEFVFITVFENLEIVKMTDVRRLMVYECIWSLKI